MSNRFLPLLLVMTPITLVVGVMLAAVTTYLMPKQYETFAVIEIKPLHASLNFTTENQRLTSLLSEVSQILDLPTRWGVGSKESITLLGKIIRVDQISGTDLFRVRARHHNREDAMDIIRILLDAYAKERAELREQSDEQKQLLELRAQLEEQEEVVEKLRRQMGGIPEYIADSASSEASTIQEQFKQETERLQELKIKLLPELLISRMPYESIIIHDEPLIPEHPISPNVRLNLILGAVIGLLAGPILAFFFM